jgi:hypothetical protein
MKNYYNMETVPFSRREDYLEYLFSSTGPFWHLFTPGTNQEIIFQSEDDYKYGITSSAISVDSKVRIIACAIMSNHIHFILAGAEEACIDYFERQKTLLMRYNRALGRVIDFSKFNCSVAPINDINTMRTEIVYVNRNGYLVNPACTPFSYKWSTGMYYFNPAVCTGGTPFSQLTYREKRSLTHSRIMSLPENFEVKEGCFFIPSFVKIKEGELWFRDAHQYFNLLSRSREAFSEVAKRLGDGIFLTDNELFEVLCARCRKQFGEPRPSDLSPKNKITAAVMMKSEYHASNGQIRRMLKLSDEIVRELFP